MTFAAAALVALAAASAQPASAPSQPAPDGGAEVETAQVTVTILRPAVLSGGALLSSPQAPAPHSQRRTQDGRVTYEFE